jgi:O-antigen ligase
LVLLVFPVVFGALMPLMDGARPLVRWAALGLLPGLAGASLWWSGSRSGWLLALAIAVAVAWLTPVFWRWRMPLTLAVVLGGLGIFLARNAGYLGKGATSASARLDYWKAAVRATVERPLLGHGPGTFMRPYARLKAPESEMARLVHNDYLEQFSDSGVPGGLAYLGWIGASLGLAWTRHRNGREPWRTGLLVGTTAWLAQGVSEFGLYVPALSWTGFVFLGWLAAETGELPSTPRAGHSKTAPATS